MSVRRAKLKAAAFSDNELLPAICRSNQSSEYARSNLKRRNQGKDRAFLYLLTGFATTSRPGAFQGTIQGITRRRIHPMAHSYWLMKSEPEELSIHDLQRLGQARWDGVRNYQARNFLRSMA